MKKLSLAVLFGIFFPSVFAIIAQSRRVPPVDPNRKNNQRPEATPTPKPEKPIEEKRDENVQVDDGDEIEVSTEIVNFPVRVLDRKGRFIAGLQKENFKVFENEKEQPIEFFNDEQQPFTVALVLDMSYSATFKINEIQMAAIAFIDQLRPVDKVMVVSFDERIHVLSEPTNDRKQLQRAVMQTRVASGTSLYDAVDLVVNARFKKLKGRKAIVLFTDGVDTTSTRAHDISTRRDVEETDALVYSIRYDTFEDVQRMKDKPIIVAPPTQPVPTSTPNPFPIPILNPTAGAGTIGGSGTTAEDYKRAEEYLNKMADRTGGRLYQANTTANLDKAFASIAAELREFYSIGYYLPAEAKQGENRRVKIKVDKPNVSIKAKDYYMVGKKVKK